MLPAATSLVDFMSTSIKQFVIPVYQRPYSWERKQCEGLWDDVLAAGRRSEGKHFAGSIVWVQDQSASGIGQIPAIVIDGQQRITTVSLMLVAIAEAALRSGDDEMRKLHRVIVCKYLIDPLEDDRHSNAHYKLVLSQGDHEVWKEIVAGAEDADYVPRLPEGSRFTENLAFFREKVAELDDLAVAWRGICRLEVIAVSLDPRTDNPQLIFEKMNDTGMNLMTADKVRNFVLMTQGVDDQKRLYRNHWRKIEDALGEAARDKRFDAFIKDWLTIRQAPASPVRESEAYSSFKALVLKEGYGQGSDVSILLDELARYAGYYAATLCLAQTGDGSLDKRLSRLNQLKYKVVHPVVMTLLDMKDAGCLDFDDVLAMLDVLESYLVRRSVCGLDSEGLNKAFPSMIKKLRDAQRSGGSIRDAFEEGLATDAYTKKFPSDADFSATLKTRNLYDMKNKRGRYILSRLEESYHPKDSRDLFEDARYTVEHIMPQKALESEAWRAELGDDCEAVYARLVDTLGNLALTAYNPELSDAPFQAKKKRGFGGYETEYLAITRSVAEVDVWNESAMEARAEELAERALLVWPMPDGVERRMTAAPARRGRISEAVVVEVGDLFRAGLLEEGAVLKVKLRAGLFMPAATVHDGKIRLDKTGEEYENPSPAAVRARELAGQPVSQRNGWDYWALADGRMLDDVRKQYRKGGTSPVASSSAKGAAADAKLAADAKPATGVRPAADPRPAASPVEPVRADGSPKGKQADDKHWFFFKTRRAHGRAYVLRKKIYVAKGSVVDMGRNPGGLDLKFQREQLEGSGGLVPYDGDRYLLERDVEMSSPSAAAEFVAGGSQQGPKVWRDSRGVTLGDAYPELVQEKDPKKTWRKGKQRH